MESQLEGEDHKDEPHKAEENKHGNLQAASAADSSIQPRSAIPEDWISSFLSTPEAQRLEDYQRRLLADQELIQDLSWAGFAGPRWERFAEALVAYGYQVLLAWIVTGQVFGKCLAQGLRGISAEGHPRIVRRDAEELAQDAVAFATVRFRDHVLKPRRWSVLGGASLKTFFIGQVLIQFVTIYRTWLRASRREVPVEELPGEPDRSAMLDPEETALTSAEANRLLGLADPDTRAIVVLVALGFTHEEIAELRGLASPKAVEARLYRFRTELRGSA